MKRDVTCTGDGSATSAGLRAFDESTQRASARQHLAATRSPPRGRVSLYDGPIAVAMTYLCCAGITMARPHR